MKLSEDIKKWRSERPDEWTMDRFIEKAKNMELSINGCQLVELEQENERLKNEWETIKSLCVDRGKELEKLEQEKKLIKAELTATRALVSASGELRAEVEQENERQAQELEVTRAISSYGFCYGYCKNFEETGLYTTPDCDNEGLDTCKFEWNGRKLEGGE